MKRRNVSLLGFINKFYKKYFMFIQHLETLINTHCGVYIEYLSFFHQTIQLFHLIIISFSSHTPSPSIGCMASLLQHSVQNIFHRPGLMPLQDWSYYWTRLLNSALFQVHTPVVGDVGVAQPCEGLWNFYGELPFSMALAFLV